MATEVGTLLISMQTDLARLRKDMDEAKGITGRAMGEMERSIGAVKNAMGLIGVGVTAGGIVAFAKSAIDAADDTAKLSQRLGIGIQDLAKYKLAADLSGASIESIAKGTKGLASYMKEHGDRLKAVGIDTTDANRALLQMADIIAGMPDGLQKTALVTEVFGKAGMDLIPFFNLGSKGLQDVEEKTAAYGKRLEELAPNAQRVNDALTEMNFQSKLLGVNIANVVAGPMASWLEANNEAVRIAGSGTEALRLFVFNLDAMTTEKPADEIRRLTQALNDYAAAQTGLERFAQSPTGALFGGREADLQKQIAFLKFLQRQQAMEGAAKLGDYRDARDLRLSADYGAADRAARLLLGGEKSAKPAKLQQSPDFLAWVQAQRAGESGLSAREVMAQLHAEDAAQQKEADALDKLRAKYVDLADPLQKYRVQLDEVNKLRALGLLSADQAINAEWEIGEAMDQAARKMEGLGEAGKDTFADLSRAIDGWGNRAADTFAEFVVTGKASFSDLISSIGTDLVRMQAKKLFDPVISQAGDWITKTLGSFFPNAAGGVYASPGLHAYANSVVDRPTIFPFARGVGLMGEAGPEAIMPLKRGSDGRLGVAASGGGGVVVQVIESPGQGGQVRQRQEGGQNIVEVLVERVKSSVAADIVRGTGAVPGAMASAYGLNRVAGSY